MGAILGLILVSVAVFGGFAMAHGPFEVLVQPSEYVVIMGAAIGSLVGSASLPQTIRTIKYIGVAFKGSKIDKATYYQLLGLLLTIFTVIRKEGVLGVEKDLADPHHSDRFNKFPAIAHNHHAMDLMVSSLRLFVDGVVNAFDLDKLMETEIDTHHHEVSKYPAAIQKMSDAFPGLGIVAAVLGIIITMQHLDGPPTEIGEHVAAALVGTFIGLLLSYGYVNPIVASIEAANSDMHALMNAIRAGVVSFAGGSPPAVAIEFARKAIESHSRPTSEEIEQLTQQIKKG
jgi:chemotaxis protein MotA